MITNTLLSAELLKTAFACWKRNFIALILDMDITSIKRKKRTLDGMANVLNEFLHGISKGFQDAAFASYSRRRSTVRDDINQSFGAEEDPGHGHGPAKAEAPPRGSSYLDMINTDDEPAPAAIAAPKAAAGQPKAKAKAKANMGLAKRSSTPRGKRKKK
jgi:hypothetical protein